MSVSYFVFTGTVCLFLILGTCLYIMINEQSHIISRQEQTIRLLADYSKSVENRIMALEYYGINRADKKSENIEYVSDLLPDECSVSDSDSDSDSESNSEQDLLTVSDESVLSFDKDLDESNLDANENTNIEESKDDIVDIVVHQADKEIIPNNEPDISLMKKMNLSELRKYAAHYKSDVNFSKMKKSEIMEHFIVEKVLD